MLVLPRIDPSVLANPWPYAQIHNITINPPKHAHSLHTRKTTSSSSPPVSLDSGKTQPLDVDSSDTPYSHVATISTCSKNSQIVMTNYDSETYQRRVAGDIRSHTSRFRSRFLQVVTVDEWLWCDFRVVAVSTCVEKTLIIWILTGIEDIVAFCAGP